jgi:hypothetical protein
MSHVAPLGPPRTSHPLPPAPSRPALPMSGAAPDRGGLRLLAARLLAEQVDRMSRADARLERRIAAGLRDAARRGRARPSTLATAINRGDRLRPEDLSRALGLDDATVRGLIRFDRALEALPRIAAAWDSGELSRAKLLALLRVATGESEEIWLERAARHDAAALGGAGLTAGEGRPGPRPVPPVGDEFPVWMSATAAVREALRPLGPGTDPAEIAAGRIAAPPVARELDATLFNSGSMGSENGSTYAALTSLRHLVALRQSVEWRLGRLIGTLDRHALYLDLGVRTLDEWAAGAPGLPPERVAAILGVDRMLAGLPATAEAWRRGRITWRQARLVARVAGAGGEREWLRRAMQVAPERLEALVEAAAAPSGLSAEPRRNAG